MSITNHKGRKGVLKGYIHLKLLSIDNLGELGKMLISLSDETRRVYHDPIFNCHNTKSYVKMRFSLLVKLLLNKWRYKVFGSYFLGIIALNERKEVVGLAYLGIKSYGSFKIAGYGIVVSDDYHGRGVGTCLTNQAIDEAKRVGVNVIRLSVLCENVRAIKLYRKFGFLIEGRHRRADVWREKISDTYTMALYLN